ncbi:hypothetical protein D3C71_2185570 [compost metagenome]
MRPNHMDAKNVIRFLVSYYFNKAIRFPVQYSLADSRERKASDLDIMSAIDCLLLSPAY